MIPSPAPPPCWFPNHCLSLLKMIKYLVAKKYKALTGSANCLGDLFATPQGLYFFFYIVKSWKHLEEYLNFTIYLNL
jgi:hypothetical protein